MRKVNNLEGLYVKVYSNDQLDRALKIFSKKVMKSGILEEYLTKSHFETRREKQIRKRRKLWHK